MRSFKTLLLIGLLALSVSACNTKDSGSSSVAIDTMASAFSQSDALSCDSFWGWLSNNCEEEVSVQQERCEGLTNAPGRSFESGGTWDPETRSCVDKWPSPICYGLLMNSCEDTGSDATHQCSAWNVACRVMCAKWDGMRFGGYCAESFWEVNP